MKNETQNIVRISKNFRKKAILFVCKGNSGRSQMAEAFLNNYSKKIKAVSAGIEPDTEIHPWTIKVMEEIGIRINKQRPKKLTKDMMENSKKIIVLDSSLLKEIPLKYLPKTEVWEIEKLLGKSLEEVRKIRDEIKKRIAELLRIY